jgi:hypothetical protein
LAKICHRKKLESTPICGQLQKLLDFDSPHTLFYFWALNELNHVHEVLGGLDTDWEFQWHWVTPLNSCVEMVHYMHIQKQESCGL